MTQPQENTIADEDFDSNDTFYEEDHSSHSAIKRTFDSGDNEDTEGSSSSYSKNKLKDLKLLLCCCQA